VAGLNVAELRAALETQLATVAGIPATTLWVKENRTPNDNDADEEEIAASDAWVEMLLGFDDGDRKEAPASQSRIWHTGTWHVWYRSPPGIGSAAADLIADAIVAAFPNGQDFTSGGTQVTIRSVGRRAGFQQKAEWVVPVKVRWEVITDNTF